MSLTVGWVGSGVNCCTPCIGAKKSISVPSGDIMLYGNHGLDHSQEWPNIMVKNGLSSFTFNWSGDQWIRMT